jgi:pimeloyl-ACP methyl ester carboxylesterase
MSPSATERRPVQWTDSSGGVRVALHDLGGSGPFVLLAHATGFAGRIWEPVAQRIEGYHCFAFDARTHGCSATPPDASRSWHGVADDVLAAVDALELHGCLAAGHSMGAAALLLAELARPGTFSRLYCYEPVTAPAVTDEPLRDFVLAELTLRRRDRFGSVEEARRNFRSKAPFDVCSEDSLEAYLRACFVPVSEGGDEIELACPKADESQLYREGRAHGLFERLGEIGVPVVVAAGAVERGGPSAFAAEVVERLADARLVRHDDLGHFGPQQDPARIAADIVAAWATPAADRR